MLWTTLGVLACVLMAVPGVIALTAGRLPPRLRASVVRPELWGYGGLMSAVGLGTEASLRWLPFTDFFGLLGFALILLGFLLQSRAKRLPAPR
jgi:hypothetical protein